MGTRVLYTTVTPLDLYTMGAPVKGILSDGTARPLSRYPSVAAGAFPRITTACYFQARHGITIGYLEPLGFPVPGHLAGIHPSLKRDARLAGITPPL